MHLQEAASAFGNFIIKYRNIKNQPGVYEFKALSIFRLNEWKNKSIVLKVRIAKKWETIVGIYRPPTSASVPQSL